MIARTAPGTEFDRKTPSDAAPRRTRALWLGMAAAALAITALAGAFALRSQAGAVATPGEAKPAAALIASDSPPQNLEQAAPVSVVASSAAASVNSSAPAVPQAKAVSSAKGQRAPGKLIPAKSPPLATHKVAPPKYTRD